jgi:uncharacterized membrane protein
MTIPQFHNNSQKKISMGGWLSSHAFQVFLVIYGLWVFIPFLAPVFMNIGWTGPSRAIYVLYSFFCHQLPERSLFFFGEKSMYSLGEIQAAWFETANPMVLRRFIGDDSLGWKVAWSDRMISFYTSIWLFALLGYRFRHAIRSLSWRGLGLLLLPILVDGGTHAISDLAGIGQGFRDTNSWLAAWTGGSLHASFYQGDALGSFNSIIRLVTGVLAGLGIAWVVLPFFFHARDENK